MKDTIALLLIYMGFAVAGIAFWVWLGVLLIWKIFAVVGAASLIFPAFYIMAGGVLTVVTGAIIKLRSISK